MPPTHRPGLRHARSELADPRGQLDLPGRPLPPGPGGAGRGRRARPLPDGRPGTQPGPAGRDEPGVETGRRGPGRRAAAAARQLRRGTGPRRPRGHRRHPRPDRHRRRWRPRGARAEGHAVRRPGREPGAECQARGRGLRSRGRVSAKARRSPAGGTADSEPEAGGRVRRLRAAAAGPVLPHRAGSRCPGGECRREDRERADRDRRRLRCGETAMGHGGIRPDPPGRPPGVGR